MVTYSYVIMLNSNSQYNETNIFNSTNGIPQASDSINFEWVDEDITDDIVEE